MDLVGESTDVAQEGFAADGTVQLALHLLHLPLNGERKELELPEAGVIFHPIFTTAALRVGVEKRAGAYGVCMIVVRKVVKAKCTCSCSRWAFCDGRRRRDISFLNSLASS
jgi:hypothetical protein